MRPAEGNICRRISTIHPGKINSAELYASSALFRKLWPQLLQASAVEAIGELRTDKKFQPVSAASVREFLANVESGAASQKNVSDWIELLTRETPATLLFETRDLQRSNWIHRSYLTK